MAKRGGKKRTIRKWVFSSFASFRMGSCSFMYLHSFGWRRKTLKTGNYFTFLPPKIISCPNCHSLRSSLLIHPTHVLFPSLLLDLEEGSTKEVLTPHSPHTRKEQGIINSSVKSTVPVRPQNRVRMLSNKLYPTGITSIYPIHTYSFIQQTHGLPLRCLRGQSRAFHLSKP